MRLKESGRFTGDSHIGMHRRERIKRVSILVLFAVLLAAGGAAGGEPAPHFESLKADLVFMREGPSTEHRVKWVYHRKGLPVEVIAEYDVWRRVRDSDGEVGWIHVALLQRDRTALVTGEDYAPVRLREDADSALIAEAEPGAVALVERCGAVFCRLDFDGLEGWVDRARIWGVYADERF